MAKRMSEERRRHRTPPTIGHQQQCELGKPGITALFQARCARLRRIQALALPATEIPHTRALLMVINKQQTVGRGQAAASPPAATSPEST